MDSAPTIDPKETNTKTRDLMNNFPVEKINIFLTVIGFTYNVLLDQDLDCTCKNDDSADCAMYITLPSITIFFFILWTDKVFRVTCAYWSKYENKKGFLGGVMFYHIIKAAVVGGLWAIFVLIDGDWYVCCGNSEHPQLACKGKTNFTADEQDIFSKLKNKSRNIGFGVLGLLVILGFLKSLFNWRKCCKGMCCKNSCCCEEICDHYDKRGLLNKVIVMKSEDVLLEVLNDVVNENLRKGFEPKIRGRQFNECLDVVRNMIENREEQQPLSGDENTPAAGIQSKQTARSSSGPQNPGESETRC